MEEYRNDSKNILIQAERLEIDQNILFGKDISIAVRGLFKLGANSIIKNGFKANGENITIGENYYYGPTKYGFMDIGGGGSNFPFSNLEIGDGCVMHTGHINIARPVKIGNNVGLSHDVDIITHGFWHSILDGGSQTFKEVSIGNDVIVGWKSVILPGVSICDFVSIGANSTVTKSITQSGVYAGMPAKYIKSIDNTLSKESKETLLRNIVKDFEYLLTFYEINSIISIFYNYPNIQINSLTIDVEKLSCIGEHDVISDAFRDFLRRYGIRIHAPQGFKFDIKRKK
jgi:acetyltransferase-like isoleucine patch superfamily enzyme